MTEVQSMTGFASATRGSGGIEATCDIRSVNNKGLDIRLRLPAGLEALEPAVKKMAGERVARGSLQVSLSVRSVEESRRAGLDEDRFRALADAATRLARETSVSPPTADGLLLARGVVIADDLEGRVDPEIARQPCLEAIGAALETLVEARAAEGEALRKVLASHIDAIAQLVERAESDPANRPEAILARLKEQVSALLDASAAFDETRLHSEAALLATKADIREEIDRLKAHVDAARRMLSEGGAIGRKLDFLAQEFNRETNTICSKSASAALTATGLDLKAVIDQLREQVQNLQ